MNERMSQQEWASLCDRVVSGMPFSQSDILDVVEEVDRARASELALLARVAELEAAAAGETGTPKAQGLYWCEWTIECGVEMRAVLAYMHAATYQNEHKAAGWYTPGMSQYIKALPCGMAVARYWRLPGETYTEKPHDT